MAVLAFIPGCLYFYNSFQLVLDVASENDGKKIEREKEHEFWSLAWFKLAEN